MWRLATLGVAALAAGIGWISVNPAAAPAGTPVTPPASDAAAEIAGLKAEIMQLKAEIEQLKGRTPDQSHVMKDVGYHFANLWFAGQQQNWPLATFYLTETRSHLKWAVRIIPVRKTQAGEIDLRPHIPAQPEVQIIHFDPGVTRRE
jgi:hypothetical protein